jgi:hypothetical protein
MENRERQRRVDRRGFLRLTAAAAITAFLAACKANTASTNPTAAATGSDPDASTPEPSDVHVPVSGRTAPSPAASAQAPSGRRTLYRGANLATGQSAHLETRISILVADGRIAWIRPTDAEEDPGPAAGLVIVDARGTTIVPGLVDAHSHVVLPGGVDYRARFHDRPAVLAAVAERNGLLAWQAGVRWLRDVGSPIGIDPIDGRRRALALGVRDGGMRRTDPAFGRRAPGSRRRAADRRAVGSGLPGRPGCPPPHAANCAMAPISSSFMSRRRAGARHGPRPRSAGSSRSSTRQGRGWLPTSSTSARREPP